MLKSLNQLALEAKTKCEEYKQNEIALSENFKSKFSQFLTDYSSQTINYSTYTSNIRTNTGLNILIANQWFYIASFFVDFLVELEKYKSIYNELIKPENEYKDLTKKLKTDKIISEEIESKINEKLNGEEVEFFKSFLTNYEWWFGSKTIDRGDYYVSPILSLGSLVNNSQSYVADIAYTLSRKPSLVDLLYQSTVQTIQLNNAMEENILEDFINWFASKDGIIHNYFSGKYSQDKDKLRTELLRYEEIYKGQFDRPIFEIDLQDKNAFHQELESNLYLNEGEFFDFSAGISNHMPRAVLGKKNYLQFLSEWISNKEASKIVEVDDQINFDIQSFKKACHDSGLKYSEQLITRFASSLITKPFLILTGLSGSGKTKLAQAFVKWICQDKSQYRIVPVGPDWTNREPLLGYPNSLNNEEYLKPESGVIELMLQANKTPSLPHFLILDEMNLSHVERYFADFLSVMESKEKISLHSDKEKLKSGVPFELEWPNNLFLIGTVNIDETTYMFSPKVLDRANVIEFRIREVEMQEFLIASKEIESLNGEGSNMAVNFIQLSKDKSITESDLLKEELINFFKELQNVGAEFGYRTAQEIQILFSQISKVNSNYSDSDNEKIDIAIMQKLLPKLHGSRRKLDKVLIALGQLCYKDDVKQDYFENDVALDFSLAKYPLSLEKITRMYNSLVQNGFTSYAEA